MLWFAVAVLGLAQISAPVPATPSSRLPVDPPRPVPSASARAAAQPALLDVLAEQAVSEARGAAAWQLLMSVAGDVHDPALRFELLVHARRCAIAADAVDAAVFASERLAAEFAVALEEEIGATLAALDARARLPAQRRAGAWLASARRSASRGGEVASRLAAARVAALGDEPPGLRALVERECRHVAAHEGCFPQGPLVDESTLIFRPPADLGLRRLALLSGAAVERARELEQRGTQADDAGLTLQAAEHWLSLCREQPEALHSGLRQHAARLLGAVVRAHLPSMLGERQLAAAEASRARHMYEGLVDRLAAEVGVVWRFVDPAALAGWPRSEGRWQVVDGGLRGTSIDDPTRCSAPLAFSSIQCVTIRGGLAAGSEHNFRFAVGDVNVLLNWEVADENHLYSGDARTAQGPRALTPGREHVIRLCQFDDLVVVLVDGKETLYHVGHLAGPITVYPALGSQIVVRSIEVWGDVDLDWVVTGPTGPTR